MEKGKKEKQSKQRVITPMFKSAFVNLFKPGGMKGAEPKYSITMLFKKDADLTVIKEAMRHAKIAAFGENKAKWPKNLESPVVDGDDEQYSEREGYAGHYAIKATCSKATPPQVVDYPDIDPILNASDFYPGCFARAHVFARVWEFPENSGRFGVQFILDSVQKLKDGKPFGGKQPAKTAFGAAAAFEDIEEEEVGDREKHVEDDDFR